MGVVVKTTLLGSSLDELEIDAGSALAPEIGKLLEAALREVIGGNISGKGEGARPIARFTSPRAASYREWVQYKHGSDRSRMEGHAHGKLEGKHPDFKGRIKEMRMDHILQAVARDGRGRVPSNIGRQAQAHLNGLNGLKGAERTVGLARVRGLVKADTAQLGGWLQHSSHGKGFASRAKNEIGAAERAVTRGGGGFSKAGFGFQTGRLSEAWYNLSVKLQSSGNGLQFVVQPSRKYDTSGTIEAVRLTTALIHQAGKTDLANSLFDKVQLVRALEALGVVVLS